MNDMNDVETLVSGPKNYYVHDIQENFSKAKKGHKAELVIMLSFFSFNMAGNVSTNQSNIANFKNNLNKQEENVKNVQYSNYTLYNMSKRAAEGEVSIMSEVTQKDLNETERYFDGKIEKVIDKIDKVNSGLNDIEIKITGMQNDISNLPTKLKASKWDYFLKNIAVPIGVAVVTALVINYLKL